MIVLLYSRHDLPLKQASLFNFVLSHLPTKATFDVDREEWKDAVAVANSCFFMGDVQRLPTADNVMVHIIRELTWNAPDDRYQSWSVDELPYRMATEGIYLIPFAVESFYSAMLRSIPVWEESIKSKCRKAVLCTVKKAASQSWNIMRSNEDLQQPPYQIPPQVQEFLDASTGKYRMFFDDTKWNAANHLWAERLSSSYCSMGYHSDRRLDLSGDIRLYTDYSEATDQLRLRTENLSALFEPTRMSQFLRQPGMRCLEVQRKNKNDNKDSSAVYCRIPMPAGSMVLVSEKANSCLQHAIRGQPHTGRSPQESMVLTYRGSNTWVHLDEQNRACLTDGQPLVCVRKQLDLFQKWLQLCRQDNQQVDNPFAENGKEEVAHWCVSPADQHSWVSALGISTFIL